MILFSIITPLFNNKHFLSDTYQSVISQTIKDFEWIIVDDCSTDGGYELAIKLSNSDSRIKVIKTSVNAGTSRARNIGLDNASGKYICFLDSDDLLDSTFLEEQYAFIKNNGPIVTASYRRWASSSITNYVVPKNMTYKSILRGNPLSCLTTVYEREVFLKSRFPENMKKCEDYVFWLNILRDSSITVKGNTKVLATYRIHESSKSHNKLKLIKYMFYVYHKTQHINIFKSMYYVCCWALYGKRKYKNVK